jgi:UPF0716 protein FxsA
MFFIPLPILLIEILVFTTFVHFFEFWDVVLAYIAPSFLGAVLFSLTGRSMMMALQGGLGQGQLPADRVLHKGAVLLGSILLIIPMFLTRILAVFLVLPIFRHLAIFIFKNFIFKRLKNSPFSFVRFGGFSGGAAGSAGGFGSYQQGSYSQRYQRHDGPFPFSEESRQERDAEVLNVTPLEITHTKIVEDDKKSDDSQ